ncbi:uncharacterized [Tachysurus ichikawai]
MQAPSCRITNSPTGFMALHLFVDWCDGRVSACGEKSSNTGGLEQPDRVSVSILVLVSVLSDASSGDIAVGQSSSLKQSEI